MFRGVARAEARIPADSGTCTGVEEYRRRRVAEPDAPSTATAYTYGPTLPTGGMGTTGAFHDAIADLPLRIDDVDRTSHRRETSSGFVRTTTTFALVGDGERGRGEDVSYDAADHEALDDAPASSFALDGTYTFREFSAALDRTDLFPTREPTRESARAYRRWALESAGLDLALRQADTSLGAALGRTYDPLRFVVSTRLGEPPTADRVSTWLDIDPDLEFKLDATTGWTSDLVAELAATGAVRIVDLKGQYHGTEVDQPPDPDLYERVVEGFPDAIVEDPAITGETRPTLAGHEGRISWDAPATGVEAIESLPIPPRWLNVKPSRFGTVASLLESIEYCLERDVSLYGGGQFELGVGRSHAQAFASLFYPDGPNDVAPTAYNEPTPRAGLPASPLDPPGTPAGIWE